MKNIKENKPVVKNKKISEPVAVIIREQVARAMSARRSSIRWFMAGDTARAWFLRGIAKLDIESAKAAANAAKSVRGAL